MKLLKIVILTGFYCLCICNTYAQQQFAFHQKLDAVDSAGFYQLSLTTDIQAKSKNNLADIRIFDSKNNQVPFVIKAAHHTGKSIVTNLPIISKSNDAEGKMHVVLHNSGQLISALQFVVKNNDVTREVALSGSDDSKLWYIIKENIPIQPTSVQQKDSYILSIQIPPVNYPFLKVVFAEKDLLPANIISAAAIGDVGTTGSIYDTVRSNNIAQKDSNKQSLIIVYWQAAYPIERFQLFTSDAKYFRREGTTGTKKYPEPIIYSSQNSGWIDYPVHETSTIVRLQNADNPALQIDSAIGLVRKQHLYAWLEKDKNYSLYFGDSNTLAPDYDLPYFKELVPGNAPMIKTGAIEMNDATTPTQTAAISKNWIWWSLGIILVILLFFTFKLTKEVDNKN